MRRQREFSRRFKANDLFEYISSRCWVMVNLMVADWLRRLDYYGWHYVCRTPKNSQIWLDEKEHYRLDKLAVQPGQLMSLSQVAFSKHEYGPVVAIAFWQKPYKEPLYLLTNLELANEAVWSIRNAFGLRYSLATRKAKAFILQEPFERTQKIRAVTFGGLFGLSLASLSRHSCFSRRLE